MNQLPATNWLPLPKVLQASGSELDPKDAVDGVIVHIDGKEFGPGATVDVSWVIGNVHLKPARRPGHGTTFEYALTAREMALGIGQDAYVSYDVKFADKTLYSPALHLRIGVLSNIPSPRIMQAIGDSLDLMTFSGDADLVIPLPIFCEVGDKLWLDCSYKDADGVAILSRLANGSPITGEDKDNGWRTRIRRTLIESIEHKNSIVFIAHVALAAACCQPPILLPALSLTKLGFVHVENFDAQPTALISAGQRIETPLMTIELISGGLQAGIIDYPTDVPLMRSSQCIVLCNRHGGQLVPAQLLGLRLKTPYRRVRFALTSLHGEAEFLFYDTDNQLQGALSKQATDGLDQWVEFHALGKPFGRIEIRTGDYCFLDNFTFWG